MEASAPAKRSYRFGLFEVDPDAGTLARKGVLVKLQDQPLRVLCHLLRRPGQIVTREEIRCSLWPNGTYVEFDGSLNTALKRLRSALGDDADNPTFIQTVPKRGYRFIAPVECVAGEGQRSTESGEVRSEPSFPKPRGEGSTTAVPVELTVGSIAVPRIWYYFAGLTLALGVTAFVLLSHIYRRPVQPTVAAASSSKVMLAVLPFDNLTGNPANEYFSDGLTEELITQLAELQPDRLGVIARTSVMSYKHGDKSIALVGRQLGVQYVVEGSLRQSSGQVSITAQLIQVRDQTQVWAQDYDRELGDVLTMEREISTSIAHEIQLELTPQQRAELAQPRKINPEAHDAYLKALFFYYEESRQSGSDAIQYVQRAIQLNPNYAEAYALLAACYYDDSQSRWGNMPNAEAAKKAKATALKALELNDSLAEPHVVLGAVADGHDWDWATAESEFKRAIELDPGLVSAHVGLAWHWTFMEHHEAALAEINRAVELDPVSDYSLTHRVYILFYNRQYDQVIQQARSALELFPGSGTTYSLLGRAYEAKGMYAEAVSSWQEQLKLEGESQTVVAALGNAFKTGGIEAVWRWELDQQRLFARRAAEKDHPYRFMHRGDPYRIAEFYALLGQKDKAFEWLEKEYPRRGQGMLFVRIDPYFDTLRSDSRFQNLMVRTKFPPHSAQHDMPSYGNTR